MQFSSADFKAKARQALRNQNLQTALQKAQGRFVNKRAEAVAVVPEFEALRESAAAIKDHTLQHLDFYLQTFEQAVIRQGGQVHWAETGDAARKIILNICRRVGAQSVAKGKSMVGEEIDLNEALQAEGMDVIETDLGEYIIQLAKEPPSHIIAPAVHKTRAEVSELFYVEHQKYGLSKRLSEIPELVNAARKVLREKFLQADVGITGANFLIAQTGSNIIVTNEGNGDLTCTLPRVHIVIAGIEKLVPSLHDATVLLRLLARSATGQETSTYTTISTGPKRLGNEDGPDEYHVVLLDNGRSRMLGGNYQAMLRCIRCGACLNHCPVYSAIGGHAYGWVYPGPMGAVLTPLIKGLNETYDLPNACTLNGHCQAVCPVKIPLPDLLRELRHQQFQQELGSRRARLALWLWAGLANRPSIYRYLSRLMMAALAKIGKRKGRFTWLPFAGAWTKTRDFPAPQRQTFIDAWQAQQKHKQS